MFKIKSLVAGLAVVSSAAFGFGGVVTDLTSYTYYVQQIEQANEQYQQATKHLNTAIETKNKVLDVERKLSGNYSRALRHIRNFERWKESIKDDPLQFVEDTIQNRDAVKDYAGKVERSIDSYYLGGDLFDDKGRKRSDWVNIERGKKEQQQLAFKQAIVQAETAKGMIEIDIEELQQLASDVDSTTTLKDSSDMNNSILIKLLESTQRTNSLLSDISKSLAMANYHGEGNVNEKGMNKLLDDDEFEIDESYYNQKGKGQEGQFNPLHNAKCNPFAGDC